MDEDEKVRENRLRRMAERQGLMLQKSRRRDSRAVDYGTYRLIDARTNATVTHSDYSDYGMTLDNIEQRLTEK